MDAEQAIEPTPPIPEISLAVPMYNEVEGLDGFFSRVEKVMEGLGCEYEIVCVDDGSRDGTLAGLARHRARNPRIVVVELSRNFGKDIALTAAIEHCKGRAVIPMDADLQDPPELIPELVARWREGSDMVIALRRRRDADTFLKRTTARCFYAVFNRMTTVPIPPDAGDYRLMDRKVVDALKALPERSRFMKGLYAWVGFRQSFVEYDREARAAGRTKFNYWKLWNFALDGIFSFSGVPLRVWSYLGGAISGLSLLYALYIVIRTLITGGDVPGYPSLMVAILFMGGVQLLSLGVMGEYLNRIYGESKRRPLYLVRGVNDAAPDPAPKSQPPPAAESAMGEGERKPEPLGSSKGIRGGVAIILALLIGLGFGLFYEGWNGLTANVNEAGWSIGGDRLNGNAGLNYFVQDQWRFPLFDTASLNDDAGANIIFTDSLPLAALLLKLVHPLTGTLSDPFGLWFLACVALQALAMVLLLREAGLRSILHCVAGAVIGVAMPALVFRYRFEHISLCSHFAIILALALYLRSGKRGREASSLWLLCVLSLVALLLHAYIWAMVCAVAAAAFVRVLSGRRLPLRSLATWLCGSAVLTAALMLVAGYVPGGFKGSVGGFGFYSMNLLSPITPQTGAILGDGSILDATGGQYEGFNYLGLGILLMLAYAIVFRAREVAGLIWRHRALCAMCAALLLFSLGKNIFAGQTCILSLPLPDSLVEALSVFRSSGRFFWPVAYLAAAAAMLVVFRHAGRVTAPAIAITAMLLQVADISREASLARESVRPAGADDVRFCEEFSRLVAEHPGVDYHPELLNISDGWAKDRALRTIHQASILNIPVSSAYFARPKEGDPDVDGSVDAALRLSGNGRLKIFAPPFTACSAMAICGEIPLSHGSLLVCGASEGWREKALASGQFGEAVIPAFPYGERIQGQAMSTWMVEDMGAIDQHAWTIGRNADWFIPAPPGAGALRFEVECLPQVPTDAVVFVNGEQVTAMHLDQGDFRTLAIRIPPEAIEGRQALHIRIALSDAPTPRQLGTGRDTRHLGLLVRAFNLTPEAVTGGDQ